MRPLLHFVQYSVIPSAFSHHWESCADRPRLCIFTIAINDCHSNSGGGGSNTITLLSLPSHLMDVAREGLTFRFLCLSSVDGLQPSSSPAPPLSRGVDRSGSVEQSCNADCLFVCIDQTTALPGQEAVLLFLLLLYLLLQLLNLLCAELEPLNWANYQL